MAIPSGLAKGQQCGEPDDDTQPMKAWEEGRATVPGGVRCYPRYPVARLRPNTLLLVLAMGFVAWGAACGDGGTGPPPPDPPRPTTVTLTPSTAELTALGATVQFRAEVRDQHGQAMVAAAVSWSSSAVVVTTVDASGLATAVRNGTATITATAGSASGTAAVAVAQQVNQVDVAPKADTLVQTDTLRLSAEATDVNGHSVAGAEFDWQSNDTLVAAVDHAGLLTGVGTGEAEVTAISAGVAGRAAITVVAPAPTTVAIVDIAEHIVRDAPDVVGNPVQIGRGHVRVLGFRSGGLPVPLLAGTCTRTYRRRNRVGSSGCCLRA